MGIKYRLFLIGLLLLALASLAIPRLPLPVGLIVYVSFAIAMAVSALKHRSAGWISGVLLATLLLTLPLWLGAMYRLYERWQT
jgi:hypothetical protein